MFTVLGIDHLQSNKFMSLISINVYDDILMFLKLCKICKYSLILYCV